MSGTKHSQASQMKDIDGRALAAAFESGVAWLGEHKSLIDPLNVESRTAYVISALTTLPIASTIFATFSSSGAYGVMTRSAASP